MNSAKIKIRPVKPTDSSKLNAFLESAEVVLESITTFQISPIALLDPLRKAHSYFPFAWKFLHVAYLAIENDEIVGFISLLADSKKKQRWKIDKLYLRENSYDVGKLLTDYIVNKYGAQGVEVFLAEVDSLNTDALTLFKNSCGFRECSKQQIFKININGEIPSENNITNLRRVSSSDSKEMKEFYFECLNVKTKTTLEKTEEDFKKGLQDYISSWINGFTDYNWILEDVKSNIITYASISTKDNETFFLNITAALPFSNYYPELLDYLIRFAGLKNKGAILYIIVNEAIQSHSSLVEELNKREYQLIKTNFVIVKDYWRPLKEKAPLKSPAILAFPDGTSTAYNSCKINKTS